MGAELQWATSSERATFVAQTHGHHHGKKGRASYYLEDIPLEQAYARFYTALRKGPNTFDGPHQRCYTRCS
jgi:hypothetical protein